MVSAFRTLVAGRGRSVLATAVALGGLVLLATPAVAAASAQLQVTMTHANPYGREGVHDPYSQSGETFTRGSGGNEYKLTITNVGSSELTGSVEVVDNLPTAPGESGEPWIAPFSSTGSDPQVVGPFWVKGAREGVLTPGAEAECVLAPRGVTLTCSTKRSLAPGASYEPITIQVSVSPDAAPPVSSVATVVNHATVKWTTTEATTGEEKTTDAEGDTTITPAVPFGIHSFGTYVEGEPFTQAGGHPLEYNSGELVLNYVPSTGQPVENKAFEVTGLTSVVAGVGGGLKDANVELPPGLLGDVQSTPRCPLRYLSNQHCPPDTAEGYVTFALGGSIKPGGEVNTLSQEAGQENYNSKVWNMQPAPGSVAALGFDALKFTPIVLEASLRSGTDYGATVVGIGTHSPQLVSTGVTICENGVVGASPNNHCRKPSEADTRPFLTNPTQCAGAAPVTTVQANSWDEPETFASKSVYTGRAPKGILSLNGPLEEELFLNKPSGSESFLTGCANLHFEPTIKFEPSPASEGGTTQADEPTGVNVGLNVPQAEEKPGVSATPALKNLKMELPAGMTVSPSAASGLEACTKAQFWPSAHGGAEPAEHREPAVRAECPNASQVGTVEVFTPLLSGAPVIEGESKENFLSKTGELEDQNICRPGAWSGGPWEEGPQGPGELVNTADGEKLTLSYQWLRNGEPIAGKTENANAEEGVTGQSIQCQVTASNEHGSSVSVSHQAVRQVEGPKSEPVEPPFAPSSIPAPSGAPTVGETLTCQPGVWIGAPTLSYKWLRDAVPIAGAESSSYPLSAEDQGKVIQCEVIGKNVGGTVLLDSAAVVVGSVALPAPPLPGAPLKGQLFVGQPECSPCSTQDAEDGKQFPLFIQILDPGDGLVVKLHGSTRANGATGQLKTVFEDQPQTPFEVLSLKLKGGPRAPLANSQSCGPATTTADLTPWSASGEGGLSGTEPIAGTLDGTPSSSFNVSFNGAGEACPATLPFAPTFNAGTSGPAATVASASPFFSLTFGRHDREQDLSGLTLHMPLGLVGKIPAVKECGEAEVQAAINNQGECPADSEVGTATAVAGPGPDPYSTYGHVYLTGPYKGGPFGLAVVTLAKAGPFNLGNVVVRSAITINPNNAAVTVTSDPLPQIVSGVPIRLREVNVNVTKPGFMLNPTNCNEQHVSATIGGSQGAGMQVSSPFAISGCKSLPFKPIFTATTQANTSKVDGASLNVKITYPQGAYANIAKTVTDLPVALPSRLTTIQKACVDTVFETNPALCDEGSEIGYAIAHTPTLNQPLAGPAYLISHGNRAFPDLEIVLQGEGVTVVLDGQTDIKKGITKTSFESVPDAPISTFELNLPEGPHSALAANINLCSQTLLLPTVLTGQNGAVINQSTHIAVTGCPPTISLTRAKLSGNALLVTVKLSAKGTVRISGKGLKSTKKSLTAGTHQIRVAFTKLGRSLRAHGKKSNVHFSLTVGKEAVAKTTAVRL